MAKPDNYTLCGFFIFELADGYKPRAYIINYPEEVKFMKAITKIISAEDKKQQGSDNDGRHQGQTGQGSSSGSQNS